MRNFVNQRVHNVSGMKKNKKKKKTNKQQQQQKLTQDTVSSEKDLSKKEVIIKISQMMKDWKFVTSGDLSERSSLNRNEMKKERKEMKMSWNIRKE